MVLFLNDAYQFIRDFGRNIIPHKLNSNFLPIRLFNKSSASSKLISAHLYLSIFIISSPFSKPANNGEFPAILFTIKPPPFVFVLNKIIFEILKSNTSLILRVGLNTPFFRIHAKSLIKPAQNIVANISIQGIFIQFFKRYWCFVKCSDYIV